MRKHLWHILLMFIHCSEADEQINILSKDQSRLSGKTLLKPEHYFWNRKDFYFDITANFNHPKSWVKSQIIIGLS